MNPFLEKYGYCILPENTLLYRGHNDSSFQDCMFFSTEFWVATAFHTSIQVWKTTKEIKLLFLVDHITKRDWSISSIPALYHELFEKEQQPPYSDLDIKDRDLQKRNQFVHQLFHGYQIPGWLSSVEGKCEIEICLFDRNNNSNQLELIEIVNSNDTQYFKDSLQKIKIFPNKEFYEKSMKSIYEDNPAIESLKKKYRQQIKYTILEDEKNGHSLLSAIHYWYNLKIKLKL